MFSFNESLTKLLDTRFPNSYRKSFEFEYEVFKIKPTLSNSGEYISLYISVDLPLGYDAIDMKIKFGIINKNNHLCLPQTLENKFKKDSCRSYGTSHFIPKNKLHNYAINNDVSFGLTVIECNIESNQKKQIQAMYEKMFGLEDQYRIKYEKNLEYLQSNIVRLQTLLDSKPEPVVEIKTVEIRTEVNPKDININNLDENKLQELQVDIQQLQLKITQKLTELKKCQICMDKISDCVLIPCGHKSYCIDCIQKVDNKCPCCRSQITNVCKIY